MKKITAFAFLLALATGAVAQSASTVRPTVRPGPTATNSTVNVPPVAKVPPVAVTGKHRK